jgi:hypothetical protein
MKNNDPSEFNTGATKAGLMAQMARETPDEGEVTRRQQKDGLSFLTNRHPELLCEDRDDGLPPLWDTQEELWEDLKHSFRPFEANPIQLRLAEHLKYIGSPEDSFDGQSIEDGQSWKSDGKRVDDAEAAVLRDYKQYGWPLSEGNPKRWTTREEHREIMRRLAAFGLTMPGSAEALVEHNLADLVRSDLTTPEFLIQGILRRGGAMLVYGPSGIGKSWFTTTLMMLAAGGNSATAADVLKAGEHTGAKVCLFDGEMVLADIAERARLLKSAFAGLDVSAALENISLYSKADTAVGVPFPDLLDRAWHKRIIKYLKENSFDIVVLDNLSTLCPTLDDENSAAAWAPFNDLVVALKRESIAVIVVHHASKNGGYRGSSNLVTTLETVIGLKAPEGSSERLGACFTVHVEKARNSAPIVVKGKTLRLAEGKWLSEIDEQAVSFRVVTMIRSLDFCNQAEIARTLSVEPYVITRLIQRAIKADLITKEEIRRKFSDAKELRDETLSKVDPDLF